MKTPRALPRRNSSRPFVPRGRELGCARSVRSGARRARAESGGHRAAPQPRLCSKSPMASTGHRALKPRSLQRQRAARSPVPGGFQIPHRTGERRPDRFRAWRLGRPVSTWEPRAPTPTRCGSPLSLSDRVLGWRPVPLGVPSAKRHLSGADHLILPAGVALQRHRRPAPDPPARRGGVLGERQPMGRCHTHDLRVLPRRRPIGCCSSPPE